MSFQDYWFNTDGSYHLSVCAPSLMRRSTSCARPRNAILVATQIQRRRYPSRRYLI